MIQAQPLQVYHDALGDLLVSSRGDLGTFITGATADSREVRPGWVFVAIPGSRFDGTEFIGEAVEAGAAAIVAKRVLNLPPHVALLHVSNAYAAAARIAEAAYGYPANHLSLVSITGTNGKTTCAYLLRDILRHAGLQTGMIGTVQYEIGHHVSSATRTTPTPFDLQRLFANMYRAGMNYVVMEMSSHALVQRRPGSVKCAAGLFTNLTGDHCDYHGTMENYFAAKTVLFDEYLCSHAPAVINCDDAYGLRLYEFLQEGNSEVRPLAFGTAPSADVRIRDMVSDLDGIQLTLQLNGESHRLSAPLLGRFNIYNVAGAAAVALALGLSPAGIAEAVARFRGAPGRLQPIAGKRGIRALVDYAHTDDALCNVLTTLRELEPNKLIVVFGCGGDRDKTKRPRMGEVASRLADRVIVTSDNPRSEDPQDILSDIRRGIPENAEVEYVVDRRQAIHEAVRNAAPGDLILVAGKGHETYQEVAGSQLPFSDVEETRKAMQDAGIL
ncbi:MAG: UDP-N-acetylmuramoyl-L-alanyl-D-glutamate--2,6-diaminopimelate ligase [Candidatus Pacebacteria bacterium]|nr:UDP-N-acetylmuramoyl-L-alanyl-D-glutamate--2,6-diaminopimelate ligase [Candidatus Paceibacterota bacterium]